MTGLEVGRVAPGWPVAEILLAGAPRTIAIANGTLAAAIGLGLRLWLVDLLFWLVGHLLAVWATKRDAQIADPTQRTRRRCDDPTTQYARNGAQQRGHRPRALPAA